ncbi:MAG: PHP domain-containing protein [Anaerolineae bacterium]|nr:PHP domain-containing protein [Anaerolineae bacterium]
MEPYREYIGNLHIHSSYSDGKASHQDIAQAANAAGLDFIIVTDHNIWPQDLEGYYRRTLILIGEEIHNVRRRPQSNHLLVYNAEQEMAPYSFGSPQTLIRTVQERHGFCYIAHPVEKSSPLMNELAAIPWTDWPVEGITGLEIWNYMSEFKGLLWSNLAALIYAFRPEWGIRGPNHATLRLWNELLHKGQRLAAIGGADAHGSTYTMGPLKRTLFPYEYLFRCVNTHILTRGPLKLELEHDKALIYEALRAGRTWVGYDLPRSTRGFRFTAQSGAAQAMPGEELKRLGAVTLYVSLPTRGEIHLLRDGQRVRMVRGTELRYTSVEPGIYRVEVYRRYKLRKVGWIFPSPIYVT